MRSVHPRTAPPPPHAMARYDSSPQENHGDRSAYQPSISIFMFDLLQASGLDAIVIVDFTWRALNPSMSCRSPVSLAVRVMVTTPPLRAGGIAPIASARAMAATF